MGLIDSKLVVGIFRGFTQSEFEFHADLVLPYRSDYHLIPMHGQFVVVELEQNSEAVLGRMTSVVSEGRLTSPSGEDYSIRAIAEQRAIPEDLKDQYLRYRVNIRVLGVLRESNNELTFAPSHRRLPHVGSRVAFLPPELLRDVAGHNIEGADLGFYALGEFVYAAGDQRCDTTQWMRVIEPAVAPKFPIEQIVSRRTFVFARAGFGKSNLVKLLFSLLYQKTPVVQKRGDREVPVGTIVFDLDGEYFWPDDNHANPRADLERDGALQAKPVIARGPDAYFTRLPLAAILRALKRHDIPAALSLSAGVYVCNTVMYSALHTLRRRRTPAGFIHLPYEAAQAAHHRAVASMSLGTMTTGVEIALETIARVL